FNDNAEFRKNVTYHLALIGKTVYPTFPDQITPVKRHNILFLCPFLPVISFAVIFINSQVGILLFLMSCLFNIILSATLKRTYEDDLKSIFYASNVLKQGYTISKIKHAPQPEVNFKQFRTARHLTSVLAVVNDEDIGAMVIKLVKLIFMLDYVLFHSIQKSYTTHMNELKNCFDYIAELDNHYSLAMYRRTLECYTEPQIDDSNDGIVFSELTHPLIADAVANDFSLSQNILLTGSNASGKSTFMKSIAINIILASAIQTVTAGKFVYQPGIVFTSMANADDVLSGDSYFMAELKSIKRIVEIPDNQKIYCFIDEIFKGTNTTERIAASESVLSFLHEKSNFRVIAATHDIELAELLKQRYENYHFNEVIENNNIHFDYKIKPGKANTRNAIELLKITSFPAKIYERAKDNVSNG
ncbi:TPA: MutS family DNA mismatch repair protein, partial [Staphylococcus aureus]|nr:MutS family DNA mismatch repair protein [Staphylococcus aureus]